MNQKVLLFFLFTIILIFPSLTYADPPTLNIPPTNAFDKIHSSNGTITAANFSMPLTVKGSNGVTVTSSNATHTLIITGSGSGGTNQGTYNKTLANNVLVNSLGNRINYINGTNTPIVVTNDPTRNQVNITISSASGSGSVTGSQNIGKGTGSQGVLAAATPTTIRGKNVTAGTGITVSGNTTDITITNSQTQGITSLNFTTNNDFDFRFIPRNMSLVQLIGQVFLFQMKNNVLLANESAQIVTKMLTLDQLVLGGDANVGSNALTRSGHKTTLPLTTGTICQINQTAHCGTDLSNGTITQINNQTGPTILITNNAKHNTKITSSGNVIHIDSNNTAYPQNIYSNSGSSGGSGSPIYINNTNTTLSNFKTALSLNQFSLVTSNKTNLIINSSVPTTNVIDIYDTTIGDYTTPTSATASSTCCYTNFTNTGAGIGIGTAVVDVTKVTGLTVGAHVKDIAFKPTITGSGSIRVKVYQDDGGGGNPNTLLGQANTQSLVLGWETFPLTSTVTVPASGNLWIGFEENNATSKVDGVAAGGTTCQVAHAYGVGPTPFGACTSQVFSFNIGIIYNLPSRPASNVKDGNTATFWQSNQEVHPWIYVDTGSAQILSLGAMFWNSTSSCTQLLLQTSSDASTWNTKRTTNTNLLTNNAWNYERWNLDTSTERYVRFYCNDAGTKDLSFYELKVLIPTSTNLLMRHGHEFINGTNATLPLNR